MGVSPAEERKERGRALDSVLHELLLTELELSLHLSVQGREDLGLPLTERRYYRRDRRLSFPHAGTRRHLMPDAGFLLSVREGSERTSQNVAPALLWHAVEMDNATMSLPRFASKLEDYDLWSRTDDGREYLANLYRRYGAAKPRPNFRLLIVCHDKSGVHKGGDERRLLDLFALALELPAAMRDRIWLTTVERLKARQTDDPPLSAALWFRARDAREWLSEYRGHVATVPRGRGRKRYHNQRAFVAERLDSLPLHALFLKPSPTPRG